MWHKIELFLLRLAIQLRNLWGRVREKLLLPLYLYWACLIFGLPACIYWTFRLPPAGVAIGALGAVGVLVALKDNIQSSHRFWWAVITLFLLVIEVRAIGNDRTEQFEFHLHELSWQREAQAQTLELIVEENRASMMQNDSQFQGTVSRMEDIGRLSHKAITLSGNALRHLTGGDAFCYLVPLESSESPEGVITWKLAVGNSGDVDLPSCDATMADVSRIPPLDLDFHPMSFGKVHTNPGYVTTTQYGIRGGAGRKYHFRIWTPTREFYEIIDFPADPSVPGGTKKNCELHDLFTGELLWGGVGCPTLPVPKAKRAP
jgi:hypothetical protein